MDERVRFVARLLDGEKMAVLCEDSGISRPLWLSEVSLRERATGSGFQLALECNGAPFVGRFDHRVDSPWPTARCLPALATVMRQQPRRQIRRQAGAVAPRHLRGTNFVAM
jgi:hypothetical protein